MPGRGTTDDIILFALRQRMEKHRGNQKRLHMVFIDVEKTYDRVPRQEIWICTREKGAPENCVRNIVLDMYGGAITHVKCSVWLTDKIPVSVGLYQ